MYAMDSMRIEKGYRSWKQDLSTDYTMLEGGLERFVKLDKADFVGKDAIAVNISGVSSRLCDPNGRHRYVRQPLPRNGLGRR